MSLVLLVTAFLGFNSLTGTESIRTTINSQPALDTSNQNAKEEVGRIAPPEAQSSELDSTKNRSSKNPDLGELQILNAQLETAAAMVETLILIEESIGSNN